MFIETGQQDVDLFLCTYLVCYCDSVKLMDVAVLLRGCHIVRMYCN